MADLPIISVPPRVKDHTGARFGRLTVLGYVGMDTGALRPRPRFVCRCDCGKMHEAQGVSLTTGMVKSCGCLQRENGSRSAAMHPFTGGTEPRHGMSRKPEHNAWSGMKQRCLNPSNKGYVNYGGRGIQMCHRWQHSFESFYADMGPRPTAGHSLERIDNDGNYEPGNVRWATDVEQANNKRDSHLVTYEDRQVSLADAERMSGISQKVLWYRINKGWPEQALFLPVTGAKRFRDFR